MAKYLTWDKARRRFVFQKRIPEAVRAAFGGRAIIRIHLGDIPEAEAVARAAHLAAHYGTLIEQATNHTKSPRHREPTVAIRFALDEEIAERFIQTWRMRTASDFAARLEPLRDAPESAWERLEEEIEASLQEARRCLRRCDDRPLAHALGSIQSDLNLRIEGSESVLVSFTHDFNGARVTFLTDCLAVVRGDMPVSALYPPLETQLPLVCLWGDPASVLADTWQARIVAAGGEVNLKTLDKYTAIARDLETILIRRPVQSLTETDIIALKSLWGARGNRAGTIQDKLSILLTLLRPFNVDDRLHGLFAHNSDGGQPRRAGRLPFTDAQARTFLGTVIGNPSVRREDQMLVALLILLGCRIEEIYQLQAADFTASENGWLVRLADRRQTGSGEASLKNTSSARCLPLHSGVFPELDAWLRERIEEGGLLFPEGSSNRYGIRSAAASKRLNRLLRALFPDDRRLVLQSTRSTANRAMRRAETDPRIRRRFLGHADADIHERHYDPGELLDDQDLQAGSAALAAFLRDVLGSESRSLV